MATVGYVISVTTSSVNKDVWGAVQKFAREGHTVFGMTIDSVTTDLFVVPISEDRRQDFEKHLKAVPDFAEVIVIPLSEEVQENELAQVRTMFLQIDVDSSAVTDEELTSFIKTKLQRLYTYYIDLDIRKNERGMIPMRIKRLEDHPQFSPDWLKVNTRTSDFTGGMSDEIEVHEVVMSETEFHLEPPPPPPPPPAALDQMSDTQIKNWMRNNYDPDLKDEDIDIIRTAGEVQITMKRPDMTEGFTYAIKK